MPNYCVNRNLDSQKKHHEVHRLDKHVRKFYDNKFDYCHVLPKLENRISLGDHTGCKTAVAQAKQQHYSNSDGCYYCANECNTG